MVEKIINNEFVEEKEVDEVAIRVKAIILNSKKEILLGYAYNTYQFPGGHINAEEPLVSGLDRELKEETGLNFNLIKTELKPFYSIAHYTRNYRNTGKVRKNIIYYFLLKTDTLCDEENNCLDKAEQEGDFKLLYVHYDDFESLLIKSIPYNEINKSIVDEMLEVMDVIKNRSVIVW